MELLDKVDKNILNILQVDAKITNAALAQKINLSPAATLERVKKLEQHGIIKGYAAQIDYVKLGFLAEVIMGIRLQRITAENIKLFKTTIDKIDAISQVLIKFNFFFHGAILYCGDIPCNSSPLHIGYFNCYMV